MTDPLEAHYVAAYVADYQRTDGACTEAHWLTGKRIAADAARRIRADAVPIEVGATVSKTETVADRPTPVTIPPPVRARKHGLYDLRRDQSKAAKKTRIRGGKTVLRDPKTITGIVLHQTAVEFGTSGLQVVNAGGDANLALARRALKIGAHVTAFRRGFFAAAYPLDAYVYHGNKLNAATIGLEVDGCYPGLDDDPETLARREDIETTWRGEPTELTATTIETAREALRWIVETARGEGMPIRYIYAHRQSSATRRSDPGQSLWREVVLEYAVPVLGLETDPTLTVGDGRPVPLAWDPGGEGRY